MQSIDARINALADHLDRGEPLTPEERVTAVQVLRAVARDGAVGCELMLFKVGDRVRFVRPAEVQSAIPPIGWEGVVEKVDTSDLPYLVRGAGWPTDGGIPCYWFYASELDLVAAA